MFVEQHRLHRVFQLLQSDTEFLCDYTYNVHNLGHQLEISCHESMCPVVQLYTLSILSQTLFFTVSVSPPVAAQLPTHPAQYPGTDL